MNGLLCTCWQGRGVVFQVRQGGRVLFRSSKVRCYIVYAVSSPCVLDQEYTFISCRLSLRLNNEFIACGDCYYRMAQEPVYRAAVRFQFTSMGQDNSKPSITISSLPLTSEPTELSEHASIRSLSCSLQLEIYTTRHAHNDQLSRLYPHHTKRPIPRFTKTKDKKEKGKRTEETETYWDPSEWRRVPPASTRPEAADSWP